MINTESFTILAETESTVNAEDLVHLGPVYLAAPTIGINDLNFNDGKLVLTVGIGTEVAGLAMAGEGDSSGINSEIQGIEGTFDVSVDVMKLLEGSGGIETTGKWGLSVDSFYLEVPNVFISQARGIEIGYDPNYDPLNDTDNPKAQLTGQTIMTIDSSSISFPQFDISGSIETYDPDGLGGQAAIPGMTIWENGFRLGTAMICYGYVPDNPNMPVSEADSDNEPILDIENILVLDDIRIGISNFEVIYGEELLFDGEIFIASGGATFLPGMPFSTSIVDRDEGYTPDGISEKEDTLALKAGLTFTDGVVDSFILKQIPWKLNWVKN
jgi:hypothetical protein